MSKSVDYDDLFKSVLDLPSMEEEEDPNPSKHALYADLFDSVLKNTSQESVPSSSQFKEQPSDQLFKKLVMTSLPNNNDKPTTPDASGDEVPVQELSNLAPKKVKKFVQKKNVLKPKKLTMKEGSTGLGEKITNVTKHKTVRKTMKDLVLELQRKRIEDADGTWVQCSNHNCLKFRYLNEVKEPIQIPSKWYCSMNKDPRRNSCQAPEENHKSDDDVFLKYVAGSIVWAKVTGYPPWPAMVDDDPDVLQFFWMNELSETPTHYHVVFLDDKVSRAWISAASIEPFVFDRKFQFSTMVCGKEYKHKMKPAIVKANQAMDMSIQERLLKFSFVQNYHGTWPPSAHPVDVQSSSEVQATLNNEEIANLHDSYLEEAELMMSQLRDIEASFEIIASQQQSQEKDKKMTTKQSKKTGKQTDPKEKSGQNQLTDNRNNHLEIAEVMLSQSSKLEASFDRSTSQQQSQEKDKKVTTKQSKKKATLDEDKREKVKVVRKRSKSSIDKTAENASKLKVKKRSSSIDIVSNKPGNSAAKIPTDGASGGPYYLKDGVELKNQNKKAAAVNKTTHPKAENKVKPIFKIKRKSKEPDGGKSITMASTVKVLPGLQSKVLKPALATKKVAKSPEVKLSQDLFPASPEATSQANEEPTFLPKGDLEFNIDSLFKDTLDVYKEE